MDGFSACRALRALPGGDDVSILMLTARDDDTAVRDAFVAGATDFVTKPVHGPLLNHRVRFMLRAHGTIDELKASKTSLAVAQRIAQLGNFEIDLVADAVAWSTEARRLLGSPEAAAETTIEGFLAHVHREDRDAVATAIDAARAECGTLTLDLRCERPDGSVVILHLHAETVAISLGTGILAGTVQDVTERREAEDRIRFLAYYDNLTGLPNRVLFNEALQQALARAKREETLLAAMFLDLDHFKRINDTLGHSAGDHLLRIVGGRLREVVRETDSVARGLIGGGGSVARLGGDEFILFLTDLRRAEDAARIAGRMLEALQAPVKLDAGEVYVSASIGIVLFPQDGSNMEELLKNADAALYHAKDAGRNNYQFYDPSMNAAAFQRLALEGNLRRAIDRDEFELHYQPKVSAREGRMVGLEALVRWRHPDLGLVMPGRFIPLAEESGLIVALGRWVLKEACEQVRRWQAEGREAVCVAVNLSGQQFRRGDLLRTVDEILAETEVPSSLLELEITETVLMENAVETEKILADLKLRGIKISVDDFGTGYSSLSYLKRFPLDALKIDRSFVRDITTDPDDAAIVAAIVALARSLKIEVIAEGVENPAQREYLHEQGCDCMQGYMFGKPAPADEIARLLPWSSSVGDVPPSGAETDRLLVRGGEP
jgi:diguanylate cyclase (GGDEF)-like protein